MAVHAVTNKHYYFIDKCLPFGSSQSCAIFQEFSDALAHIVKFKIIIVDNPALMNYLDDFLFIAMQAAICNAMMGTFLQICADIGCPISEDKTSKCGMDVIVFLGMLLNGHAQIFSIPHDKVIKALNLLQWAITQRKDTIKYMQQLTGTLNFLNRAIVPGSAFTRGMYSKLKLTNAKDELLKQHHHLWLKTDFIQDCKVWHSFLTNVTKVQLCRPYNEFEPNPQYRPYNEFEPNPQYMVWQFFSDASLNKKLGFGAIFQNR